MLRHTSSARLLRLLLLLDGSLHLAIRAAAASSRALVLALLIVLLVVLLLLDPADRVLPVSCGALLHAAEAQSFGLL